MFKNIITVVQIVLAIGLIASILVQSKGTGLGRAFGGATEAYSTRRGVEKVVYYLTIIIAILFFISSLAQLLVK